MPLGAYQAAPFQLRANAPTQAPFPVPQDSPPTSPRRAPPSRAETRHHMGLAIISRLQEIQQLAGVHIKLTNKQLANIRTWGSELNPNDPPHTPIP